MTAPNVLVTPSHRAFTLIELLVTIAIIGLLLTILIPSLTRARDSARGALCLSNERQIGMAARSYMNDNNGSLFHHHEGWVLDDGSQIDSLPGNVAGCVGGGSGNSQAEKPWVILFQPYLEGRQMGFCPSDPTDRSQKLTTTMREYNGNITSVDQDPPPDSELAIALAQRLTITSYVLNSVFTHRSCRYAMEGVLDGFLTDSRAAAIKNGGMVMFSERDSEALNAPNNDTFGSIIQDDYDTWVGEAALVRWGTNAAPWSGHGWIRHNRHLGAANYFFEDGHGARHRWRDVRQDQFPDRVVRGPLTNPPP